MSITKFIEDIRVYWSDFGDDNVGIDYTTDNVLEYYARPENIVSPESCEAEIFGNRPDHLLIEIVIRFAKLHYHENTGFVRGDTEVGELDLFGSPSKEAGLVALERRWQNGLQDADMVDGKRYMLPGYLHFDVVDMIGK